ncbi:MAG: nucleoside deaminase [Leptospiraceae bacterium]|nr:nucleoside deaminase [Leptospiraceae bacterium]
MYHSELIKKFKEEISHFPDAQIDEVPSFSSIFEFKDESWRCVFTASNIVSKTNDTTLHSEIIAIKESQRILKNRYLTNYILITTLEPCLMCTGAIVGARIKSVVYLSEQTKQAGISSLSLENIYMLNHFPELHFIKDQDVELEISKFFKKKR